MILFMVMMTTTAILASVETAVFISTIMLAFLFLASNSFETVMVMGNQMSMDSYSFNLIFLTLLIFSFMPSLSVFLGFTNLSTKVKLMMALQLILIMIFLTSKTLTFYILFELSLVPIFMIIAGWGYQFERLSAGAALIMYTVTASLPLLVCVIWLNLNSNLSFMHMFSQLKFSQKPLMFGVCLMIMTSFLVKLPIFLGHLWLPKAHVEAPASGSMILAAILLKLGGYSLLRFIFLFSPSSTFCVIISLALWGGVLSGLICTQGLDLKIIVAYSSVAHMAIVIGAMLIMTQTAVSGGMILMIAHGFSSSGLFFWVGVFSKYSNSRSLILNKSLIMTNPMVCCAWFLILAAGMGIPPSLNFWSELVSMVAICSDSWINLLACALLVFLAGAYTLILYSIPTHSFSSLHQNKKIVMLPVEKLMGFIHVVWAFLLVIMLNLLS
uniref:NADH dehydrogenase subunit 4 n=1 Tax=Sinergasilus major TaxID=232573 RepID=UPI00286B0143|nr:NADH dehydrogenase subunit 4 [Sinergasilus major]WKB17752.1 NADH dehydrogenase subunit 4 [Sinergasilus major]